MKQSTAIDDDSSAGNRADKSVRGALGFQIFFNDDTTQLTTGIGVINSWGSSSSVQDGIGAGLWF